MAEREPDRLVRVWTVVHLSRGDFVVGGWKVVYVDCLSKPSTNAVQSVCSVDWRIFDLFFNAAGMPRRASG